MTQIVQSRSRATRRKRTAWAKRLMRMRAALAPALGAVGAGSATEALTFTEAYYLAFRECRTRVSAVSRPSVCPSCRSAQAFVPRVDRRLAGGHSRGVGHVSVLRVAQA